VQLNLLGDLGQAADRDTHRAAGAFHFAQIARSSGARLAEGSRGSLGGRAGPIERQACT
jgi:hypothetical protein